MKNLFKPFSNSVIFLDTEFSTNDPYKGEILSIGLVKMDGSELYLELEHKGESSDWVKQNLLPILTRNKISREDATVKIKEFVGNNTPYVISYVNQFEIVYLHKLFSSKDTHGLPFFWIPIDFASILFGNGLDPHIFKDQNFLTKIGVDNNKFRHTHNALDDARLLREVYLKMTQK